MSQRTPVSKLRTTTGRGGHPVRVGPIHIVTVVLVGAAVASVALALTVSGGPTVQAAGGAATADSFATAPLLQPQTVAASGGVVSGGGAVSVATPSNVTDSDNDGLGDAAEREIGTDPTDPDTDGDGIPDGPEVRDEARYPAADPLRQDVYVEVDATGEQALSRAAIDRIEAAFAAAPVDNPDGSTGMTVHVLADDRGLAANGTVYSERRPGPRNDIFDFRNQTFDARGSGYYYVLLTADVAYDGQARYVGAGRPGIVAMETFDDPGLTASLFMHELGHAFGLDGATDGIDDDEYSAEEYDSVMNYNGLYEQLTYSDGSDEVGRDEWAFVARDRYRPTLHLVGGQ